MEIMELLQKAQRGDRQSRNQIVEENVGWYGVLSNDLQDVDMTRKTSFRLDVSV